MGLFERFLTVWVALGIVGAVAAEDQMGMRVDQPRRDPATLAIDGLCRLESRGLSGVTCIDDLPIMAGDDPVFDLAQAGSCRGKRGEAGVRPDPIASHVRLLHIVSINV